MHYWAERGGNLCGDPHGGEWRTTRWERVPLRRVPIDIRIGGQ